MNTPGAGVLPHPTLSLVTDHSYATTRSLATLVAAAVLGGVDLVQLREKDLPGGDLLTLATDIRESTAGGKALFIVNDRVDVALAADADGVQLGENAMSVDAVRRIAPKLFIGRSVHSVEGAREAEVQGADFLVVGTIFPTGSKVDIEPAGPGLLERIATSVSLPFLAIGGVTSRNVSQVMAAGATGAAVISAILGAPDPRVAAVELKGAMAAVAHQGVVSST